MKPSSIRQPGIEVILLGTHILTPRSPTDIALHIFRQLHTVLHVLILNELKHDVTLRRIWVVAVIGLLIVFLKEDHRVLTLGHLKVLGHTRILSRALAGAQRIGLETACHPTLRQGVDMQGDKEVGLVAVGNLGTLIEFHKDIGLTGIDHPYIRAVALHHASEGQGKLQRQVLLFRDSPYGTGIMPAVTSIDDKGEFLVCSIGRHYKATYGYQE